MKTHLQRDDFLLGVCGYSGMKGYFTKDEHEVDCLICKRHIEQHGPKETKKRREGFGKNYNSHGKSYVHHGV